MIEAQATRAGSWQALRPDHQAQMGDSGANLDVSGGAAAHSQAAPHHGVVIVSIPSNLTVRARIGEGTVAVATDQAYYGPSTWHWPVRKGERVSLFGDATSGTVTISMAA